MKRLPLSSRASILIALAPAIGACPLEGQTISYFRQFTTPDIGSASAVTADGSGIYVTGNRTPPQGGPGSAGIRKDDFSGNEIWTRTFTLPDGTGAILFRAATDASGIYVLGETSTSSGAGVLRKYTPQGDELWTRHLEFAPRDMAADDSGVYLAGRDFPPNATYLRKYDRDGAELWTSRFGDQNNLYGPLSVGVDSTGVYMVGMAGNFAPPVPRTFAFVRKWDSRGNPLWNGELDVVGPFVFAAADPAGFYVAGLGSFLRKYDAGGQVLWTRQLDVNARAMAADAKGVYLVGTNDCSPQLGGCVMGPPALPGQCTSGSGGDSFVRRYDPDGVELWTREFGASDATQAFAVAVDGNGIYVIGQTGTAAFATSWELPLDVFAQTNPTSTAFLAKLEKSPAVVAGSGPRIFPDCVVNAASYVGGGVAPGEIVTIFGSGIGPPKTAIFTLGGNGTIATTLAGTRLLFNGIPAPLLYVSAKQSTAIVPYRLAGQTSVDVQAEYNGTRSEPLTVPVLASRPGIFTLDGSGQGQGVILNEDGTLNSTSNPARWGSVITMYGTGGGEASPSIVDGQIVSGIAPTTGLPVSVWFEFDDYVAPKKAEVLYAGGVSGAVAGLLQVNVRVPQDPEPGNSFTFLLIIGSQWESQVNVALR